MKSLFVLDEPWDSALTNLGFWLAKLTPGNVTIAAVKDSPAYKRAVGEGMQVFEIPNLRKVNPLFATKSLSSVYGKFSPELVVTIRGDASFFSALLKPSYGFKLIRIHGEAKGIKDSFLNRLLHKKFVDGVVVSSEKLSQSGVLKDLPKVIVRGVVDTEVFKPSEATLKGLISSDRFVVGAVGRLDRIKGYELLIKAVAQLKDVHLLIVGQEKGVKASYLLQLAQKLGFSDRFTLISRRVSKISEFMNACDVGVVSSIGSEMIARSLLEFMSCAKPVVGTNVGVIGEIIKPSFGLVCEPEVNSLKNSLKKVKELDVDAMGKMARLEAERKYSPDSVGKVWKAFAEKVLCSN